MLVASPEAVASVRTLTADIEEFTASSARLNTEIKNLEAERTPHTKMRTRQIEGGRTRGVAAAFRACIFFPRVLALGVLLRRLGPPVVGFETLDPKWQWQAEIAKNTEALDKATALRQKELAEFNAEEKDMLQSIGALKSAVTVLSKHNSFAQARHSSTAHFGRGHWCVVSVVLHAK